MVAPGMKVARAVATAPGSLVLGTVTPDGAHVVWCEIVDHLGQPASRHGMQFTRTPKLLTGEEYPCPLALVEFVR